MAQRTNNPYLKEIEDRAIEVLVQRAKDQPATAASSTSKTITVWGNELNLEIGAQMVHDVRANVKANIRGCPLCYMIAGIDGTTHKSGNKCPKMPLTAETEGWVEFKNNLEYPEGIFCWNCLLPMVRSLLISFKSG